ncbi:MAG: hypothetical protein ACREMA_07725, partial [Longimicrobiales bacterium]
FDRAAMRDQQLAEGLNEVVVKVGVTVTSQELIDAVAAADADRIAAETAAANAAASAGTAAAAGAGFFRAFLGGL